ncbi:hypothetical protein ACFXNW_24395 [Nocardia sp. NPDC059180]|uniref:hypothetical protein n=1 Tax=Nocardia sp. NPDC059180 TaxID=3346761 RepID=UPI0036ABF6B5
MIARTGEVAIGTAARAPATAADGTTAVAPAIAGIPREAVGNAVVSSAVDATVGNRVKAARLGADRATTAAIVPSAATGTAAVRTAADTGTGATRTGETPIDADLPRAGRSGEIGAMTHPGATRAIGPGAIAEQTVGAEGTAATVDLRDTRIAADTAGPAIATTDVDSMIAVGATTTLVHRRVVGPVAVGSVVTATGARAPNPDRAETSATGRAGSDAPTMRHAVDGTTVRAAATTATVIAMIVTAAGTTVIAIVTIAIVAGTTAIAVLTRAASVAATATADGRASRVIVPVDSGARGMNPVANVARVRVASVGVQARAGGPKADTVRSARTPGARVGVRVASVGVRTKADGQGSPKADTVRNATTPGIRVGVRVASGGAIAILGRTKPRVLRTRATATWA